MPAGTPTNKVQASPLFPQLDKWKFEIDKLGSHRADVVSSIINGFDMCRGPGGPPTQKTNYKSALDNFSVIDKMIGELVSNGWAEGPFDQLPFENYYLNALAAVPKRDSTDLRLIVDCRRSNVNSKIPDQPFKFKSVEDAVHRLSPSAFMAKVDLTAAYMHVPLRPEDYRFVCFEWNKKFYYYTRLPFGVKSAPFIFADLSDLVTNMAERRGIKVINYLDDFLIIHKRKATLKRQLRVFKNLLKSLGLGINEKKCTEPAKVCEFLGVLIDSQNGTLSLSEQRLGEVRHALNKHVHSKAIKLRDLQHLIGVLNWVARVKPACRPFIRRITNLLRGRPVVGHHFIRLNAAFRLDLKWWQEQLGNWTGRRIYISKYEKAARFCTDASGIGIGGYYSGESFQAPIPAEYAESDINVTESLAVLRACQLWGPSWKGRKVIGFCDNTATVHVTNKGSGLSEEMMHICRQIYTFQARYDFHLRLVHLPGAANYIADALSRFRAVTAQDVTDYNAAVNEWSLADEMGLGWNKF